MKSIIAVAIIAAVCGTAQAEMVNGYIKKDGTYVAPYYRTERDGNPYNNLTPPPAPKAYDSYNTSPPSTYQPSTPRYPQPSYPSYPSYNTNCAYTTRC